MDPQISDVEKTMIKNMLPDQQPMTKDIHKKYNLSIIGLYETLKKIKKDNKITAKETLAMMGYEISYEFERSNMTAIIAHGIFVFLRNNWHQDVHCYESSCPETLEDWYFELARFCNGDDDFSPEALHILTSCCYYELSVKPIAGDTFASSIANVFAPDAAIDLFLLDDMNRHFATEIGKIACNQLKGCDD